MTTSDEMYMNFIYSESFIFICGRSPDYFNGYDVFSCSCMGGMPMISGYLGSVQ